jgi:hypothetical protein
MRSTVCFALSMWEVVFSIDRCQLVRRTRTFDSGESLAEHYEVQMLLRGEPPTWPEEQNPPTGRVRLTAGAARRATDPRS